MEITGKHEEMSINVELLKIVGKVLYGIALILLGSFFLLHSIVVIWVVLFHSEWIGWVILGLPYWAYWIYSLVMGIIAAFILVAGVLTLYEI
jgi:hypothetical protein